MVAGVDREKVMTVLVIVKRKNDQDGQSAESSYREPISRLGLCLVLFLWGGDGLLV